MSDDRLASVRAREYPESPEGIFLNTASWGLVPRSAAAEAADLTLRRNLTHGFEEAELGAIQRRCRTAVATLLSTDPRRIALAPNTSFGVNLAAALLREGAPGTILISEGEFPANVLPFKALERHGFRIEMVPATAGGLPDEERLLEALGAPGVRALTISAVQFASGYLADLEHLGATCRELGVLYFVDAIQAVGVVPFPVEALGADVVACGGQKWLCAPWGSGFVWIAPEVQESLEPPMVSWLATSGGAAFDHMLHYDMNWRRSARKFELATLGIQDYLGLARAIEVLLEVGVESVRRHVHALHQPVIDWIEARPDVVAVTPMGARKRAGILSFLPKDLETAVAALQREGVVFSVREGSVRLAPHWYNTREEMEEVVRLLDR